MIRPKFGSHQFKLREIQDGVSLDSLAGAFEVKVKAKKK